MLRRYVKQSLYLLSSVSLLPLVSVPTRLPHHPDPNCAVCLPRAADLLCGTGMCGECHFKYHTESNQLFCQSKSRKVKQNHITVEQQVKQVKKNPNIYVSFWKQQKKYQLKVCTDFKLTFMLRFFLFYLGTVSGVKGEKPAEFVEFAG